MPTEGEPDPQALDESTKESIEKARDLLDGMKIVQEHENAILGDEGPAPK
jgi:hypothetical protein